MRSVLLRAVESSLGGWLSNGHNDGSKSNNIIDEGVVDDLRNAKILNRSALFSDDISRRICISESAENSMIRICKSELACHMETLGISHLIDSCIEAISEAISCSLKTWDVQRFKDWIESLDCLGSESILCANILAAASIDGECFIDISEREIGELDLPPLSLTLLTIIRHGIVDGWRSPMPAPTIPFQMPTPTPSRGGSGCTNVMNLTKDMGLDVGSCEDEYSGATYGQLVVLGHKVKGERQINTFQKTQFGLL